MTRLLQNPVDLFVIGAGSGGVRAARIAVGHGAQVMIAEEFRIGGTCVIRGCVPKKLLVYASRFSREFEDAAGFGWMMHPPVFDWRTLVANKDKEIARLESVYTANLEKSGVSIVKSRAVIEDAHTVRLTTTGVKIRAEKILIATGATPHEGHEIPGINHVITSNEVFNLAELPARILVQGGGYIAVEFACVFAGLGSQVTLVYRGSNILRGFDRDVREHLQGEMERCGIKVLTNNVVTAVDKRSAAYRVRLSEGGEADADSVMFAVGRRPNVRGIGLDAVGVRCGENGGVVVDEYSRTSVGNIYAVGDVTNRINLTPMAVREGHAFADTVFGNRPTAVDHSNVPTAVFSEPEVGTVGLTEEQAREQLTGVDIYKAVFKPMKATLSGRNTSVLMKLVVNAVTGRVVGCHIVGEGAAEMIQLIGIAVKMGATKADIDATIAVHPTASEELVTMRHPIASHRLNAAE